MRCEGNWHKPGIAGRAGGLQDIFTRHVGETAVRDGIEPKRTPVTSAKLVPVMVTTVMPAADPLGGLTLVIVGTPRLAS